MASTATVTTVREGQTFEAVVGAEGQPSTYTVGPKCDQNHGYWYCVTHDKLFANQLAKDSHITKGKHVLAWACWKHGPEVP